jgi:hypothetical protein
MELGLHLIIFQNWLWGLTSISLLSKLGVAGPL